MADQRIDVVFGAEFSELVAAAQQVKDQLGSLATTARSAGEDFAQAGTQIASGATLGETAVKTSFGLIEMSVGTALQGVLTGTATWQQSMAKIFSNLAQQFVEYVAQMIMSWLEFEALGIAGGGVGGVGGVLGGIGGLLGFGGGGAAGGAAEFGSLAMFQAGAWSVPRDMVAMVHAGEMVLPAGVAETARSVGGISAFPTGGTSAGAGGGSAMTLNVSVQAIDAAGVASWANANAKTLATTISRYMASNPSAAGQ